MSNMRIERNNALDEVAQLKELLTLIQWRLEGRCVVCGGVGEHEPVCGVGKALRKNPEERVWLTTTPKGPPTGSHAEIVYVWREHYDVNHDHMFECRVLLNGEIEPIAVRQAKELRKEVERLKEELSQSERLINA
jgi:hypothetical protein